jgi:hypothetical protein
MCSHYQAIQEPERYVRHFGATPPGDSGKHDLWPGYRGTFTLTCWPGYWTAQQKKSGLLINTLGAPLSNWAN